jgi:putative endonuclease
MSLAAPTLPAMTRARQVVGTLGEQAACAALEAKGYRVLHRNYRVRGGELDVVCERDGTLVFCEVKTRTSALFGSGEEAVTFTKQRRLRKLALEYMQREGVRARSIRFDVVAIDVADGVVAELRHLEAAF